MEAGAIVEVFIRLEAGNGKLHIAIDTVRRINERVAQQVGDGNPIQCRIAVNVVVQRREIHCSRVARNHDLDALFKPVQRNRRHRWHMGGDHMTTCLTT